MIIDSSSYICFKTLNNSVPEIWGLQLGSIFRLLNITHFHWLKTKCWSLCIGQLKCIVFKVECLKTYIYIYIYKVNSLLCSRNQSEMIWALWHAALSCWKYLSEDGYTVVIKGWTQSATILREIVAFKRCFIGSKCAKNISSTPLHHNHQPEPLREGRMEQCFHVLYAKFWPYHLNVAAEIETHQTMQRFYNLLLSNFGESVWIVASVSCS